MRRRHSEHEQQVAPAGVEGVRWRCGARSVEYIHLIRRIVHLFLRTPLLFAAGLGLPHHLVFLRGFRDAGSPWYSRSDCGRGRHRHQGVARSDWLHLAHLVSKAGRARTAQVRPGCHGAARCDTTGTASRHHHVVPWSCRSPVGTVGLATVPHPQQRHAAAWARPICHA